MRPQLLVSNTQRSEGVIRHFQNGLLHLGPRIFTDLLNDIVFHIVPLVASL